MKVLICGIDGYQGWPCAMHLSRQGHEVYGIDNFARRKWVEEVNARSATNIRDMKERITAFDSPNIKFLAGDLCNTEFATNILKDAKPDAIIHFAEQASAPYAMIDLAHAKYTMRNNIDGTLNLLFLMKQYCPAAHLIRMCTMGYYGTPSMDIFEGYLPDGRVYPPSPGSFYHLSKEHTFQQCRFAAKTWNLRISSLQQGVIYGVNTAETLESPELCTRFDCDGVFGTVINRFCAQAVLGLPLTVFGKGLQRRGFASLKNTLRCIDFVLDNPADEGVYEVYNQFDAVYSIQELAASIQDAGSRLGLDVVVDYIPNPRVEAQDHYYNPASGKLRNLGFTAEGSLTEEVVDIIDASSDFELEANSMTAKVKWK